MECHHAPFAAGQPYREDVFERDVRSTVVKIDDGGLRRADVTNEPERVPDAAR